MTKVKPSEGRATITDHLSHLEISIPSKIQTAKLAALIFGLIIWLFGEIMILPKLFGANSSMTHSAAGNVDVPGVFFLTIWIVGWTFYGMVDIYGILWLLGGREILIVKRESIALIKKIYNFSVRTREYSNEHVKKMRVSPEVISASSPMFPFKFWGITGNNMIAFDYGIKTVRFASAMDEAEAGQIIENINKRGYFTD